MNSSFYLRVNNDNGIDRFFLKILCPKLNQMQKYPDKFSAGFNLSVKVKISPLTRHGGKKKKGSRGLDLFLLTSGLGGSRRLNPRRRPLYPVKSRDTHYTGG